MLRADALRHANSFHENLKFLHASHEQYLDEEIVLAFATNARGCAAHYRQHSNKDDSKTEITSTDCLAEDPSFTCSVLPPTIDIRDLCSHSDIQCQAPDNWGGWETIEVFDIKCVEHGEVDNLGRFGVDLFTSSCNHYVSQIETDTMKSLLAYQSLRT